MLRVVLGDGERLLEAEPDRKLTGLLRREGLPLNTRCGERGVCRGCEVELVEGEFRWLDGDPIRRGSEPLVVRGCQTAMASANGTIRAPHRSLLESEAQIDEDFVTHEPHFSPAVRRFRFHSPLPGLDNPLTHKARCRVALAAQGETRPIAWTVSALAELGQALDHQPAEGVVLDCHAEEDRLHPIRVFPAVEEKSRLGLAVDAGTTTVAALLVDLADGRILARASRYNQQIRRADDIASRIGRAATQAGLEELRTLLVEETIASLVRRLLNEAEATPEDILSVAIAGNTVIEHLALGLPVESIGRIPFTPVVRDFPSLTAAEAGIPAHPRATVQVLPCVAGYIGGDIVADLYASGVLKYPGVSILIDIGTNGEIVLAREGELLVCATAAGPAFEGAGIRHGVRAAPGAIEHVRLGRDGVTSRLVIGGGKPSGLCGSAIVDFVSEAFREGFLGPLGRLDLERLRSAGLYRNAGSAHRPLHAFLLADGEDTASGEDILVTEYDVAEVLKAKAAIQAGMRTLLRQAGTGWDKVDHLILAGGFARHLDIESAIALGLLPDLPRNRFRVVGNGSLAGAYLTLTEAEALPSLRALSRIPRVLELNTVPEFEDEFVECLAIPHLDGEDWLLSTEGEPVS